MWSIFQGFKWYPMWPPYCSLCWTHPLSCIPHCELQLNITGQFCPLLSVSSCLSHLVSLLIIFFFVPTSPPFPILLHFTISLPLSLSLSSVSCSFSLMSHVLELYVWQLCLLSGLHLAMDKHPIILLFSVSVPCLLFWFSFSLSNTGLLSEKLYMSIHNGCFFNTRLPSGCYSWFYDWLEATKWISSIEYYKHLSETSNIRIASLYVCTYLYTYMYVLYVLLL